MAFLVCRCLSPAMGIHASQDGGAGKPHGIAILLWSHWLCDRLLQRFQSLGAHRAFKQKLFALLGVVPQLHIIS